LFIWTHEQTLETNHSAESIWTIWSDTANWSTWDTDITWTTLQSPLKTGTIGQLKPKNGPVATLKITEVTPEQSFTTRTNFPLMTTVDFVHEYAVAHEVCTLTHRIIIKGWLTPFVWLVMGTTVQRNLKSTMQRLLALANDE
jgi:hypothetical protein